jgi:hypothetical protein
MQAYFSWGYTCVIITYVLELIGLIDQDEYLQWEFRLKVSEGYMITRPHKLM